MTKERNINLSIANQTKDALIYVGSWYQSGRLADGQSWPQTISPLEAVSISSYEKDNSIATGVSASVGYNIGNDKIDIAFSNPFLGDRKFGVGPGGTRVWENMSAHDGDFTIKFNLSSGAYRAECTLTWTNGGNDPDGNIRNAFCSVGLYRDT